jgi:hypothetical protein
MMEACAALGAKVPNGADEGSLWGVKWMACAADVGACIAGFAEDSNRPAHTTVVPANAGTHNHREKCGGEL